MTDEDAHRALAMWRSPEAFRDLVSALDARTEARELLSIPHKKYLLDALTLAELSRHVIVDRIRLQEPKGQWPDGYIDIGGRERNVEVTIADLPGRRRGDEYRDLVGTAVERYPPEDWNKRAEAIWEALDRAIRSKAAKRYSSPFILVVDLNFGVYGIRQAEIEQTIRSIKGRYQEDFEQIHVLWNGKVI